MAGRSYSSGSYRYGFNGQEKDSEWNDNYAFEYRIHDPRLGRFLSVDPLFRDYAYNSPYAFAENRVIDGHDLEGLEYENKTGKGPTGGPLSDAYVANPANKVTPSAGWADNSSVKRAIIDDMSADYFHKHQSKNLIICDPFFGFCKKELDQAIKILK